MDRSRFVVLKHTQPASQIPLPRRRYLASDDRPQASADVHYDLMLESHRGLLTWAVAKIPSASHPTLRAFELPLHRDFYLDYEGRVSNDRGTVERVMAGRFELIEVVPKVSLEERFQKITIKLWPNDTEGALQITLQRLEQNKFQITCHEN